MRSFFRRSRRFGGRAYRATGRGLNKRLFGQPLLVWLLLAILAYVFVAPFRSLVSKVINKNNV